LTSQSKAITNEINNPTEDAVNQTSKSIEKFKKECAS